MGCATISKRIDRKRHPQKPSDQKECGSGRRDQISVWSCWLGERCYTTLTVQLTRWLPTHWSQELVNSILDWEGYMMVDDDDLEMCKPFITLCPEKIQISYLRRSTTRSRWSLERSSLSYDSTSRLEFGLPSGWVDPGMISKMLLSK